MIRAIVVASLAALALSSSTGLATCKCLEDGLWKTYATGFSIECSWEWADKDGKCVTPTGLVSNFTDYPGDYGESCKVWIDPGHSACFDLMPRPPVEKPVSEQAKWCQDRWCYIDPCNCDASDATKSDYFPGALFYSYATCGDKNKYTALESATNTVGNAECATAAEDASDAHSLKMSFGLMFAGMGALM